ncbi:recombinase family protein [Falsiroseomonas sp. HW251]|uniref:recombinase family protein n=1 Tax=Falsiroseomonas sp. HW251 TaxID=3390998 RepID=UPI003D313826
MRIIARVSTRCRRLGAVLVVARRDRITRWAHTLSQLFEDRVSLRAADMPDADDLMMWVHAAMAQKERELISERTRAALAMAFIPLPGTTASAGVPAASVAPSGGLPGRTVMAPTCSPDRSRAAGVQRSSTPLSAPQN